MRTFCRKKELSTDCYEERHRKTFGFNRLSSLIFVLCFSLT